MEYPKVRLKKTGSKAILFYNTLANGNNLPHRKENFLFLVKKYLPESKIVFLPDENFDWSEVEEDDIVCIFGGDGTLHRTLTKIFEAKRFSELKVAYFHGGSMSTVAKNISAPKNQKLFELVANFLEGEERWFVPRISLLFEWQGKKAIGFLFGAFLVADFLKDYYSGGTPGPVQGAKTLALYIARALTLRKSLFGKRKAQVVLDGRKLGLEKFIAVGASSTHSFGLNFRTFPKAPYLLDDFNFIATDISPVVLALWAPLIYFGKLPPKSINEPAKEVEITFEKKETFTIDGDLYETENLKISKGPKINFLVG